MLLRRFFSGLHHHQTLTLTLAPTLLRPLPAISNLRRSLPALRRLSAMSTSAPPPSKSSLLRAAEAALGAPLSSAPLRPEPSPLVVVVSGPSGVGKDALIRRLAATRRRGRLRFVVTATTRAMRPGEVHGRDYFFVTVPEFTAMIERNELLEHAVVYGDFKGIPRSEIRAAIASGEDVVLRVDVQGAATLRRELGEGAVFVFVSAESEAAMAERLAGRGTEGVDELRARLAAARDEVGQIGLFDYVVVNREGELDEAVGIVGSIIDAEKARVRQRNVVV